MAHEFTELAEKLAFTGPDGVVCAIEEDHHEGNETEHDHEEEEHGHEEEGHEDEHELSFPLNLTCQNTYLFVEQLLLRLNLVSDCCLENGTACEEEEDPGPSRTSTRVAEGESQLLSAIP